MSAASLASDATRAGIALWDGKYTRTAKLNRIAIAEHAYGPDHPGFKGRAAAVDAHMTALVDATLGSQGRAVWIGLRACSQRAHSTETFNRLSARKRGVDQAGIQQAGANIRQWTAIYRAARVVYLAARSLRGELDSGFMPEGAESDDYMAFPPSRYRRDGKPERQLWRIPRPAPVAGTVAALIAESAKAVAHARIEADAANAIRLEQLKAKPAIRLPAVCGITCKPTPIGSHGQKLVTELEGFVIRLEAEIITGAKPVH